MKYLSLQITVRKDEQRISLQVDTLPVTTGRITRRVDVSAPLYVGGLPQGFRATAGIVSPIHFHMYGA